MNWFDAMVTGGAGLLIGCWAGERGWTQTQALMVMSGFWLVYGGLCLGGRI